MEDPFGFSPSSVRWHNEMNEFYTMNMTDAEKEAKAQSNDWSLDSSFLAEEEEGLSNAWDIPSAKEMERRWTLRKKARDDNDLHARIHCQEGSVGSRNILRVLADRERYGAFRRQHHTTYKVQQQEQEQEQFGRPQNVSQKLHKSHKMVFINGDNTQSSHCEGQKERLPSSSEINFHPVPRPKSITKEIETFGEKTSAVQYNSMFLNHLGGREEIINGERPSSTRAVSTISLAFSPDSATMASTHGDHTVKISSIANGHLLQTLNGHPRTPWTVKYHSIDPAILASGCLGHQVRLWNWKKGTCLQLVRLEFAIISLSFHPLGHVLAIANGSRLHFWSIQRELEAQRESQDLNQITQTAPTQPSSLMLTEIEQGHMLRCVHFPPGGKSIILGGVNHSEDRSRKPSFYLKLYDFDEELARKRIPRNLRGDRKLMKHPRIFLPRALLYNDGGFDVSPDGRTVCACAEFWLPDGINSAMELLYPQDTSDEASSMDENTADCDGSSITDRASPDHVHMDVTTTSSQGPYQVSSSPPRHGAQHRFSANRPSPLTPRTPPPTASYPPVALSPPSPPGRRFAGGLNPTPFAQRHNLGNLETLSSNPSNPSNPSAPPNIRVERRSVANHRRHQESQQTGNILNGFEMMRNPHFYSTTQFEDPKQNGRFVPHVVIVSLDTSAKGEDTAAIQPRLGEIIQAIPLEGAKASAVTCVKFSPSCSHCLIGYGVREPLMEEDGNVLHPVTALYRVSNGLVHVSTMLSNDDDVNIAMFHPEVGGGFVYGTKQGRIRVMAPRPWNFYSC